MQVVVDAIGRFSTVLKHLRTRVPADNNGKVGRKRWKESHRSASTENMEDLRAVPVSSASGIILVNLWVFTVHTNYRSSEEVWLRYFEHQHKLHLELSMLLKQCVIEYVWSEQILICLERTEELRSFWSIREVFSGMKYSFCKHGQHSGVPMVIPQCRNDQAHLSFGRFHSDAKLWRRARRGAAYRSTQCFRFWQHL